MMEILLVGGNGAIGKAMRNEYLSLKNKVTILSRKPVEDDSALMTSHLYDYENPGELNIEEGKKFDLIIFATGHLHNHKYKPEKSIKDIEESALSFSYLINCIAPLCLIKKLSDQIKNNTKIVFLSARVGSISDNNLGGWYAYRMSKAALNMMIKNLSIELGRRYKESIIMGLHPGTVESKLSAPFVSHVKHEVFTPNDSARKLIKVIENLKKQDTGKILDYAGNKIEW